MQECQAAMYLFEFMRQVTLFMYTDASGRAVGFVSGCRRTSWNPVISNTKTLQE